MSELAKEFVAPSTETEIALAGIFSAVLKVENVSANANFFELGGQSLLILKLKTQIESRFGIELKIKELFESSDIISIAKTITQNTLKHELDSIEDELLDEVEF